MQQDSKRPRLRLPDPEDDRLRARLNAEAILCIGALLGWVVAFCLVAAWALG